MTGETQREGNAGPGMTMLARLIFLCFWPEELGEIGMGRISWRMKRRETVKLGKRWGGGLGFGPDLEIIRFFFFKVRWPRRGHCSYLPTEC